MFIINKELSAEPLKLTVLEKNDIGLDSFVLCLKNMQIEERDDVVFFNSNCRGDYFTGNKSEFSVTQYSNKSKWRNQTFPMSKDGAVKIVESFVKIGDLFDDFDYEEYIELQLSKLSQETTDLLLCVSEYDDHFSLKDASSLKISLWRRNSIEEKMKGSYSDWEIVNNNDLWKEYNGCLHSYDINMDKVNSNAAVVGIIKKDNDQFILEQNFKRYKDILELVNDYS